MRRATPSLQHVQPKGGLAFLWTFFKCQFCGCGDLR